MMNSAKEMAIKLIDEMPESKIDEIIDFLLFMKNKDRDKNIFLEQEQIKKKIFKFDEKIPDKYFLITPSVHKLIGVMDLEKNYDFKNDYSNYLENKYK